MKLKVLKTFRDKETKKVYRPGVVIDITDDVRVQDMLNRNLCEAVASTGKKEPASSGSKSSKGKGKAAEPAKTEDGAAVSSTANPVEGNPAESNAEGSPEGSNQE